MTIRFKFIAAALGLVVASSAIGDVSAKTIDKSVASHSVTHKNVKVVARTHHRLHLGNRIVKHVRIVHRGPAVVKVVRAPAHKVLAATVFTKKIVHVNRAPLTKHAMNHRVGAKAIVIR